MPSTKPRLMLTLPPDLDADLRDLADARGKPLSTTVLDLLLEMQPQLGDLAKMLRMVNQGNKRAALRKLSNLAADAAGDLAEVQRTLPLPAKRKRK